MSAKVPSELAIIMFLQSMNGRFEATIAALKTMSDGSLTWEAVTARLIEEAGTQSRTRVGQSALVSSSSPAVTCSTCGKFGHKSEICWWNPANPGNRLANRPPRGSGKDKAKTAADSTRENEDKSSDKAAEPDGKSKDKALMLNVLNSKHEYQSDFLVDSGASSHISPSKEWFHNLHRIDSREICLGDNSKVTAEAARDVVLKLPYHDGTVVDDYTVWCPLRSRIKPKSSFFLKVGRKRGVDCV
jgi:hypothetical protein